MTAPNKIYLWETPIINGGYDPAWHKNSFNEGDVEYICKDALMEWASKKFGQVSDMGFDDGDVEHGYTRALEDVIDKLNSM